MIKSKLPLACNSELDHPTFKATADSKDARSCASNGPSQDISLRSSPNAANPSFRPLGQGEGDHREEAGTVEVARMPGLHCQQETMIKLSFPKNLRTT